MISVPSRGASQINCLHTISRLPLRRLSGVCHNSARHLFDQYKKAAPRAGGFSLLAISCVLLPAAFARMCRPMPPRLCRAPQPSVRRRQHAYRRVPLPVVRDRIPRRIQFSNTEGVVLALIARGKWRKAASEFADAPASAPASAPVRTILERHDQTGVPGKEILSGTAQLPAGTVIGFHTHPGNEFGYVLKGPLVLKTKGQPDRMLKTVTFSSMRAAWFTAYRRRPAARTEQHCRPGLSTRANLSPPR